MSIPASITGLPVTSIGFGAFLGNNAPTNLIVPSSVTSVGDYAFSKCASLTSVTLGNSVTSIGAQAFSLCTNLTRVTLGNGVKSIGDWAFAMCSSLTDITIPASVTNIAGDAFWGCSNLKAVYFVGNAPAVGGYAFGNGNANIYYMAGATNWSPSVGGRPTILWSPEASNSGVRTNQFGFTVAGPNGLAVVTEVSTNLTSNSWSPVGTNTFVNGSAYFSDSKWTNYPARFYRLRSP